MQWGMPTLIENNTLEENIALCRELGLSFIELNMNFPHYQIEKLEQTDLLNQMKEEADIYFTIHFDENLNVCDFNHLVSDAYLETVKRTIRAAKQLNVPLLNMHMNQGVYITLPDRRVYLYQQYKETYLENIKRFRILCENEIEKAPIVISIENTDGFAEFEKEAIDYLLQSPVFTLTWDIGHSEVIKNVDEPYIMNHAEKLCHFHIHDATEHKNHLTLGTGKIDLSSRLGIAKEHDCRCVLETKTIQALRESVNWLKDREIF